MQFWIGTPWTSSTFYQAGSGGVKYWGESVLARRGRSVATYIHIYITRTLIEIKTFKNQISLCLFLIVGGLGFAPQHTSNHWSPTKLGLWLAIKGGGSEDPIICMQPPSIPVSTWGERSVRSFFFFWLVPSVHHCPPGASMCIPPTPPPSDEHKWTDLGSSCISHHHT